MRYIFSIFCKSLNQAKVLSERLSKIQIQTILLIRINENNTGLFKDYYYTVNVLCELISTTKFMEKAIRERIFAINELEIINVDYNVHEDQTYIVEELNSNSF